MADRISTSTEGEVKEPSLSGSERRSDDDPTTLTKSPAGVGGPLTIVAAELKAHAPYTMLGTATGLVIMVAFVVMDVPRTISVTMFWTLHPLHVLLSAMATMAMFTLHGRRTLLSAVVVGYVGSVGIATLSDCIIPYVGETLLGFPNRGIHLGFIEKWWLVNPLACAGILLGCRWPCTGLPHAGHVLLSTWASLFHMTMAVGNDFAILGYVAAAVFLFLAVWIPCCTSDIVFPLMFAARSRADDRSNGVPEGDPKGANDTHR